MFCKMCSEFVKLKQIVSRTQEDLEKARNEVRTNQSHQQNNHYLRIFKLISYGGLPNDCRQLLVHSRRYISSFASLTTSFACRWRLRRHVSLRYGTRSQKKWSAISKKRLNECRPRCGLERFLCVERSLVEYAAPQSVLRQYTT